MKAILATLVLAVSTMASGPPGTMVIDGRVDDPLTIDPAALAKLPQTSVDVSFETAHGAITGHFSGVLLWDLISKAAIKPDPDKQKHHLQDTLLITGRDGYTVALAMAEIDPSFEGKRVIVAKGEGKGSSGLRLIVPDDKMGGRDVRDVAHIQVN